MSDALEAIEDIKEALAEFGSSIVIKKETSEVRDSYGNIITPADYVNINTKALIGNQATDKLLSKLTDDQKNSYSLSLRLYTTELINKEDYQIEFRSKDYEIFMIDETILQDETLLYEVLLKR